MTLNVISTSTTTMFALIFALSCFFTSSGGECEWPTITEIVTVEPTSGIQTGTVIFLHGSGQDGPTIKRFVEKTGQNASFPHLKILYPTAPFRPYTAMGGALSRVWFDRKSLNIRAPEILDTINAMAKELEKIIMAEHEKGIPLDRIVVGGFSMGGAMSLHLGYRFQEKLAGIFCLSSFANDNSSIYKELSAENMGIGSFQKLPTLLQTHGNKDDLVDLDWALETFSQLASLGVVGEFHVIPNGRHMVEKKTVDTLFRWVDLVLPNK